MNTNFSEAWYDLAYLKLNAGKTNESIDSLRRAIVTSNQRLAQNPGASNLLKSARVDARFVTLHENAAFKELVKP